MTIQIWLVDDHKIVRDGLNALLGHETDMEVLGLAEDGQLFLDNLGECCPDVVFMDIDMPNLDGIATTRQLLARCPSARVIILSMFDAGAFVQDALEAGAVGYLLKDSAGIEAIAAVRAVMGGDLYLSAEITKTVVERLLASRQEAPREDPLALLNEHEREIFFALASDKSRSDIADILGISANTVSTYRSRIAHKLGIAPGTLLEFATNHGLIKPE